MSTLANLLDYRRIWQRRMRGPARLYGPDEELAARIDSTDPTVRADALTAGPLTARLLEVALASRHDDVRLAAVTSTALSSGQLDWILRNDREEVRLAVLTGPGRLDAAQVETALRDSSDAVRIAAIQHHELTDDQIKGLLTDGNREIREAVLAHHSVDPEFVDELLNSGRRRDSRELAHALAHQPLTDEQVETALTRPVRTSWDLEARRVAALQASVERAQLLLADADPVVVETARDRIAAYEERAATVADVLALPSEERIADPGMQAAAEREVRAEQEAVAARAARAEDWWFDKAWEERAALRAAIGQEPEGPEIELDAAHLAAENAKLALREATRCALMIPAAYRDELAKDLTDAQLRSEIAQRRRAELQEAVVTREHPAARAQYEWREQHADEIARLAAINEQLAAELEREAAEPDAVRAAIPMAPSTEQEQQVWLDAVGPYAAMRARVERTGHTTDADVAVAVEYQHTVADLGTRAVRLGVVEPDWYDAELDQLRLTVINNEIEIHREAAGAEHAAIPDASVKADEVAQLDELLAEQAREQSAELAAGPLVTDDGVGHDARHPAAPAVLGETASLNAGERFGPAAPFPFAGSAAGIDPALVAAAEAEIALQSDDYDWLNDIETELAADTDSGMSAGF